MLELIKSGLGSARQHPVRGSTDARRPPLVALAGVHPVASRTGAEGARSAPRASTRSWAVTASTSSVTSAQMPMRTIGMLLGIPEEDQVAIRDQIDAGLRIDKGAPRRRSDDGDERGRVCRLRRLASSSVRRPDDRPAPRRVRGPHRCARRRLTREILGYVGLLATRQRDHGGSSVGRARSCPNIPTNGPRSSPTGRW